MLTTILKYLHGKSLERDQRRAAKKGKHICMFKRGDVVNMDIVPKCIICGADLSIEGGE